jgi:hypothetical protein
VPGPAAYYEAVHADRLRLLPDRPSSAFTAPKTRPLAEKLQQVGPAGYGSTAHMRL